MSRRKDEASPTSYASPPCFLHEIDPAYTGLSDTTGSRPHADVLRWRQAERERLINDRLAIPLDVRRDYDARIAENLAHVLGDVRGLMIAAYWPIRGEPDLRRFMEGVAARGGRWALPVVIASGKPLILRAWTKGQELERGVWNLLVPPKDTDVVVPDVVIAPVVGFDKECYRLGYGGGFFDRTLATTLRKPRVFGVGYGQAAIATIYPQPHDIPLDVVVTEAGLLEPGHSSDGTV